MCHFVCLAVYQQETLVSVLKFPLELSAQKVVLRTNILFAFLRTLKKKPVILESGQSLIILGLDD